MKISQSTAKEKSKCRYGVKSSETEWISSLEKTLRLPETTFDPSLFSLLLSCPEIGDTDVDLSQEEQSPLQDKGSYFLLSALTEAP